MTKEIFLLACGCFESMLIRTFSVFFAAEMVSAQGISALKFFPTVSEVVQSSKIHFAFLLN